MYILIILISISVLSRKGGGGDTADGGGGAQGGGGAGVLQPYLSYKTRGAGQGGHNLQHEGVRGTVRRQQGAAPHQVDRDAYQKIFMPADAWFCVKNITETAHYFFHPPVISFMVKEALGTSH